MTAPENVQNSDDDQPVPLVSEGSAAGTVNTKASKSRKPRRASSPAGPPAETAVAPLIVIEAPAPVKIVTAVEPVDIVEPVEIVESVDIVTPDDEAGAAAEKLPVETADLDSISDSADEISADELDPIAALPLRTYTPPDYIEPDYIEPAPALSDQPAEASSDETVPSQDISDSDTLPDDAILSANATLPAEAEATPATPTTPPAAAITTSVAAPFSTRQSLRASEAKEKARNATRPERRTGSTVLRWSGRVVLLALIGCLVIAAGSVVSNRNDELPQISATEQSRVTALDAAQALLAQVKQFTAVAPAAVVPATQYASSVLSSAATALAAPESQTTSSATATTSASAPAEPVTVDAGVVIAGLANAAATNLTAARTVEPGMARLLAATGSGQTIAAQYLARLAGVTPPAVAVTAPPVNTASCDADSTTGDSATGDSASPLNSGQALAAVFLAEQKAIYAYQVAATRLTTPESEGSALAMITEHQNSLSEARQWISAKCLEAPLLAPAFSLDQSFLAQPMPGLASVQDQLGVVYGDLIGLSEGPLREWAIGKLLLNTQAQLTWADPSKQLPGMP